MSPKSNSGSEEGELLANAMAETRTKLRSRNVVLAGRETSDELADLLEAVEQFEKAVQGAGGDLMMDEAPEGKTAQPDDPHFVVPVRAASESASAYIQRVSAAADKVRHHKPHR